MADENLRLRITADADQAEGELRGLDRLADTIDLDPKVDTKGIDAAHDSMGGLADAAGMLPGPLGAAAGMLTGPAGIAAGGIAAAGALVSIANSTADAAIEAKALQSAVGGSTEETSRLLAATGAVGLEYNDVLELIAESNNAMGKNADEAERLGVNLAGTPIERFQQLVDAVYKIPDPLERSAAASKFFGEEGSKQLPKLIGAYGDLATAMEAVPDGALMSEADVKAAQEYKQAMAGLKAELGAFANQAGKVVIPLLTDFFQGLDRVGGGVGWLGDQMGTLGGSIGDLVTGDLKGFINTDYSPIEEATVSTEELASAISGELTGAMDGVVTAAGEVITVMEEQAAATDLAREANEKLRDEFYDTADASVEAGRTAADLTDMVAELGKSSKVTRADQERLFDAVTANAEAQVELAGETRNTTAGAAIYNRAMLENAKTLGNQLTPEVVNYLGQLGLIPDSVLTDILAALQRGDIDTANTLLAGIDATTATASIEGDLDPTEFNEANRRADELERRRVVVNITANASSFFSAMAGVTGGSRAVAASTGRYVYRNGRRTMVYP